MTDKEFANDYDIIVYAFALLIRPSQKEYNIFAAQCIWWLASIIQCMERLRFDFEYHVFSSQYVRDCVVTPLPAQSAMGIIIPDDNISELDLAQNNIVKSPGVNYIEHP